MTALLRLIFIAGLAYGVYYFFADEIHEFLATEPQEEVIEQPVKVEKPTPVEKINLKLKATGSPTKGKAPLEVTFTLQASHPDSVKKTFIRADGNEKIYEGLPKQISYKFFKAGSHEVVVAIRGVDGSLAKDTVRIEVKEETFAEYKKRMLGE